jgi:hypothetical protein
MQIRVEARTTMTRHHHPRRTGRPFGVTWLVMSAGCALACADGALAQNPGSVTIDARRCLQLTSAEERLACFESQVHDALGEGRERRDTARTEPPAAAETAPARQAEPPPARQAEPRRDRRNRGADATEAASGTEIIGTIAALAERVPNQYVITLDNGQVWRQSVPERYPIRVGQRVRIYPGRWGSSNRYRLAAEELGGFIQVERVR